jgi:hypothetical protein
MNKKYFILPLLTFLFLSACGTTEKQEIAEDNTVEAAETVLEGEGTFVGLIDASSFEVETSEGPLILRFSEELSEKVSSIPEGKKVKYTYIKNDEKQNILKTIEEV